MQKTVTLLMAIALFVTTGCQPESVDEIYAEKTGKGHKEVSKVVSAGFWRLDAVQSVYPNGTIVDSTINACNKDDVETFQSNGEVIIQHGSVACPDNPADGRFAIWQLLNNGTRILQTFERDMRGIPAGEIRNYSIEYVAFKKMIISRTVYQPGGTTYKELTTLTR